MPGRAALSLVTLLAVALAGCPGVTRPLEEPVLDFQGVALLGVGPTGVDARIDLTLTNPNPVALPLRAIDWELAIGGASGLRGRTELAESVPANGSSPIEVLIHLDAAAAAELAARLQAGATAYHVTGMLHFETVLGGLAVPFDEEGDLEDPR